MYTIWCERNAARGIITNILGRDNKWHLATNDAAKFRSVRAARIFFFSRDADSVEPIGSCIWIRGPRNGHYPMRRED